MEEYTFLNSELIFEYLSTCANAGLVPLVIGFERCKSNKGAIGPACRNKYVVQYVIEGKGTLTTHGKTHKIEKHSLMLLPQEEVVYAPDKDDPWTYFWIEFTGSQAAELLQSAYLTAETPVVSVKNPEEIFALFAEMIANASIAKRRNCYGLFCAANLMKVLYYTALQKHEDDPPLQKTDGKIAAISAYLEEHYAEVDCSVQKLSETFYMSESYLARLFKKHLKLSPTKYLIRLRLEKAKKMLESKNFTIAAVAYACGYNSPYYFSLEFKRYTGIPPSKYLLGYARNDIGNFSVDFPLLK